MIINMQWWQYLLLTLVCFVAAVVIGVPAVIIWDRGKRAIGFALIALTLTIFITLLYFLGQTIFHLWDRFWLSGVGAVALLNCITLAWLQYVKHRTRSLPESEVARPLEALSYVVAVITTIAVSAWLIGSYAIRNGGSFIPHRVSLAAFATIPAISVLWVQELIKRWVKR